MEYKRMIAREKLENIKEAIRHYPQPQMFNDTLTGPTLFGGYRITAHPGAGNPYQGPTTLYTDDPINGPLRAGNLSKELNKIGKQIGNVGKQTSRAIQKAVPGAATTLIQKSVVDPFAKYGEKALTDYLSPSNVAALGESVAESTIGMGRAKGRPRKNKQHDFGGAASGGSFKSVLKKVEKGAKQALKKAAPLVQKYVTNAAMDYVMPAAETVGETVAANPELLVLGMGRKPKKARFAKGSPEAKAWGAKMAAARKKK